MLLFFAGLLTSIPLTLGVNLATPGAQNWLARRSASRAILRAESLKIELDRLNQYANMPEKFQRFLLVQVIRIALILSVGAVATIICLTAANVIGHSGLYLFTVAGSSWYTNNLLEFIGYSLGIVTAVIIIPLCLYAFRINSKLEHLSEYNKKVLEIITTLEATAQEPVTSSE
jgi:hypothetical protein